MWRWIAGLVVLLLLVSPAGAIEETPLVRARPVAGVVVDGDITEWSAQRPQIVLGKANLIRSEKSGLSMRWGGDRDLSGRFWIGTTATDLVIAGDVRDDDLILNPRVWWMGDEIEVFFDTDLDLRESHPDTYDEDDYQLILMPLSRGHTWGFANFRGRTSRSDGGFDGVRTAGKPNTDKGGNFLGYRFEAAIPLVNFPGLTVRDGARIGFDLALVDADGSYGQKSYMTWSGRAGLSAHPDRFGKLRFTGSPPRVAAPVPARGAGYAEPLIILAGALLVGFALWRLRRWLMPITRIPVRTKLIVLGGLLLLLAGAHAAPLLLARARRHRSESHLGGKVEVLESTLAEAGREGFLGSEESLPAPDRVLALLAGEPASPPERYEYRPTFVNGPRLSRTLGGTPVIDYALRLTERDPVRFTTGAPAPASGVSLVVAFENDPVARHPPADGETLGEVRAVLENGHVVTRALRYGTDLRDRREERDPAKLPRDVSLAWRDRNTGTHAVEVRVPIGESVPLLRVEVEQQTAQGTLLVSGATVHPSAGGTPVPLPLRSRTLVDVPTNLHEDRPAGSSLVLKPGSKPARIVLHPPVDRVWLFAAERGAGPDHEPEEEGAALLSLTFVHADGTAEKPVVLRQGEDLLEEQLYSPHPPPSFRGAIAFRWTPPRAWPLHRDVVLLTPRSPEAVTGLEISPLARTASLVVAGLTEGRRLPHVPGRKLSRLVFDRKDGTYRLDPRTRHALEGLVLTWYRGGRARWTTRDRETVLGTSLPTGALSSTGAETPRLRSLGEENYLALFRRVRPGDGDILEAGLRLPGPGAAEGVATAAFYTLLTLLLLGVLLLLADVLDRLTRLRTKLTLGFAVAALVPLLLFFFGLSGILEREIGRTETGTLLAQIRRVKAAFAELRDEVPRRTRALLRDGDLGLALAHADSDPEIYRKRTDQRLRELRTTVSPVRRPAEIYAEDMFPAGGDPGPRVFPLGSAENPFANGRDPSDDIVYQWSRLLFEGIASERVGTGRRKIGVRVPVDRDLLADLKSRFGQRLDLTLFSLRGYPYAGTLDLAAEKRPKAMRARRSVVAEVDLARRPVIREEILAATPCSVAYDLVRTRENEPVALLGVALPRSEVIAARAEIRNLFLLLGAVILLLEVIVGNILTRRVTDPLTSLARGARSVARGKLDTRVPVAAADEIGVMAESFNRMTAELERRIGDLSKLNAAIRDFTGTLDRTVVLERALDAFREAGTRPDRVLITLGGEDAVEILAGRRGGRRMQPTRLSGRAGTLGRALALSAPTLLGTEDLSGADAAEKDLLGGARSAVVLPYRLGQATPGAVILLYRKPGPGVEGGDLEFLSTLTQQMAIALANARLYQLAIEDVATGLYVHSYFLDRLREETDRAVAGGRPLSVLLIAIGEVRRIQETYGTREADRLLRRIVRRVRASSTGMHIMARADRETIEILLPETGKIKALETAKALRKTLVRIELRLEGDPDRRIGVTPAIGLASCPEDARSAEFLLNEAQRALVRAITDRAGTRLVDVARERSAVETLAAGGAGRYVFRSRKMIELLETVDRIAASDVPLLLQGETGVGKEVIADLVHERSRRRRRPLITVNCAALPETLLESELFGYERGAFTGADRRKPGRFELAHGGTIFLDEIGEMSPQTQVKLLRVLEDHRVERLGGTSPVTVDVRVIAATNRDLLAAIREGRFREDLYFRLNVVSLVVPPLRARREEIPALADHFVASYRESHRTTGERLSPGAMDRLFAHSWPGNVRELRNIIERALVIARGPEVQADEIVFSETVHEFAPERRVPEEAPAPSAPERSGLNSRQRRLLEILAGRDRITNREYADLVGISARTGNRDLKDLIERGLIVKEGRRRAAVYRLRR